MTNEAKGEVIIAAASDEHLRGVLAIWPKDWEQTPSDIVDAAVAIRGGSAWVALSQDEGESRVIGFLAFNTHFVPGSLYVGRAVVDESDRSRGVMSSMISHAVAFASASGLDQVLCDVYEGTRPAARLEKMGFKCIGSADGFFNPTRKSLFYALRPSRS